MKFPVLITEKTTSYWKMFLEIIGWSGSYETQSILKYTIHKLHIECLINGIKYVLFKIFNYFLNIIVFDLFSR